MVNFFISISFCEFGNVVRIKGMCFSGIWFLLEVGGFYVVVDVFSEEFFGECLNVFVDVEIFGC